MMKKILLALLATTAAQAQNYNDIYQHLQRSIKHEDHRCFKDDYNNYIVCLKNIISVTDDEAYDALRFCMPICFFTREGTLMIVFPAELMDVLVDEKSREERKKQESSIIF